MLKKTMACAGMALASLATAAYAQDEIPLRPYLGFGLLYNAADQNSRMSDDGYGFSTGYGVPLHRHFALEGNMTYQDFERDNFPDNNRWKEYGAEANALLTFPLSGGWVPYLSTGLGVAKSHLKGGGTGVDMAYQAGSGVFYLFDAFEQTWGFQLDAKYRLVDLNDGFGDGDIASIDETFGDVVVKLGAVLLLGEKAKVEVAPAPPPPAPAEPADADKDGVTDDKDECPDTPEGTKVDAKGCPLAAAIDSDDGVIESFGSIYFDYDKSVIKQTEVPKLEKAVAAFKKSKAAKVVLKADGHADSRGTEGYNQALSERRANVVKKYLTSKGVPADRVAVVAYGESKPTGDNETDAGRALNRRVELNLVKE